MTTEKYYDECSPAEQRAVRAFAKHLTVDSIRKFERTFSSPGVKFLDGKVFAVGFAT
jgi:hypothetical protein